MEKEQTLLIIKPDVIKKKLIGKIISIIEENNLYIEKINILKLTEEKAKEFYIEHKEKIFFHELISFITSGRIVAIILSGEKIIEKTRTLIGDTNFEKAKKNTIRANFASSITENAVHASDSEKSAKREIKIIFEKI
jgi:nucleoside-diphosphate kinase